MQKLIQYLKDAVEEFKKVTWPTKKQVINYSLLVIAISVGLALYIGVIDFGLSLGLENVLPQADISATTTPQPTSGPIDFQAGGIQATDDQGNPIDIQVTPTP